MKDKRSQQKETTVTEDLAGKLCRKCGEFKPYSEFTKNAQIKDGHHVYCKTCKHAYEATTPGTNGRGFRLTKQQLQLRTEKRCGRCGQTKSVEDFTRLSTSVDGRYCYCRDCKREIEKARWDASSTSLKKREIQAISKLSPEDLDKLIETYRNAQADEVEPPYEGHEGKTCSKCGQYKSYEQFGKLASQKDGYHYWCKDCKRTYESMGFALEGRSIRPTREEVLNRKEKKCFKCNVVKPVEDFGKSSDRYDGLKGMCRECERKYMRDYYHGVHPEAPERPVAQGPRFKTPVDPERLKEEIERQESARKVMRHNNRAARREAEGSFTFVEFRTKFKDVFDCRCAYCNKELDFLNAEPDHVIPIIKDGTNDIDNIVPACNSCNSSKGDLDVVYWLKTKGFDTQAVLARLGLSGLPE
jgi:HNH endonuclease